MATWALAPWSRSQRRTLSLRSCFRLDLCALNTWGRARASHCATFLNGQVSSQIDYALTRRSTADEQARTSGPYNLNLAPWRLGPRHRPVRASVPVFGCWKIQGRGACAGPVYSIQCLREHVFYLTTLACTMCPRVPATTSVSSCPTNVGPHQS